MTVLQDHHAPYRAHSQPRRGTLLWYQGQQHLLICDQGAEPALTDFARTAPIGCQFRLIGVIPPADLGRHLHMERPKILALGSEAFLQSLAPVLWHHRIDQAQLCAALHGAAARLVFCVACRGQSRASQRIHRCSCGATLLVRDHFSARLGLYQGAPLSPDDPLCESLSAMAL